MKATVLSSGPVMEPRPGTIEVPNRKLHAREVIVAPRLPAKPPGETYKTPFDAEGDIVVDCDVDGCGWHAMGPRSLMGKAVKAHHQMYHPDQIGVVLLNQPRQ